MLSVGENTQVTVPVGQDFMENMTIGLATVIKHIVSIHLFDSMKYSYYYPRYRGIKRYGEISGRTKTQAREV